jgi:hypothetical protein
VYLQWNTRKESVILHILFLHFYPTFLKQTYTYAISFLFVYPSLLTFECLNQFLWNLVCISWHLNPSQQNTSKFPLISLRVHMCIPLLLLANGSAKMLQWQQGIIGGTVLYAVHVISKESRRLVIPRTSCNIIISPMPQVWQVVTLPQNFQKKFWMHFSSFPFVPYTPPTSIFFIWLL